MSVKRSHFLSSGKETDNKRYHIYDSRKVNDILLMLHDELSLLDKSMYVQRNQHRRTCYYKSMENLIRYCKKVEKYTKDLLDHFQSYEEIVLVDGLLQVCCLIYKGILQGKNCARNSGRQVSYGYFLPLCSVFLAASCRLIELNLLLLKEILPLQQQLISHNPEVFRDYSVPESIVSLVHVSSASELKEDVESIPLVDDSMFASYIICLQQMRSHFFIENFVSY